MSYDRRTDGPVLLSADVATGRARWRRRPQSVRVTSRRLWWGTAGSESSVDWTRVLDVRHEDGALLVRYLDEQGARAELRVVLEGPVGYLVAEEVQRRTQAAHRNAALAGAVAC